MDRPMRWDGKGGLRTENSALLLSQHAILPPSSNCDKRLREEAIMYIPPSLISQTHTITIPDFRQRGHRDHRRPRGLRGFEFLLPKARAASRSLWWLLGTHAEWVYFKEFLGRDERDGEGEARLQGCRLLVGYLDRVLPYMYRRARFSPRGGAYRGFGLERGVGDTEMVERSFDDDVCGSALTCSSVVSLCRSRPHRRSAAQGI